MEAQALANAKRGPGDRARRQELKEQAKEAELAQLRSISQAQQVSGRASSGGSDVMSAYERAQAQGLAQQDSAAENAARPSGKQRA